MPFRSKTWPRSRPNRPTCNYMTENGVCGKPAHNKTGGERPTYRKVKGVGYVCGNHYHYFKPSTKKGAELALN